MKVIVNGDDLGISMDVNESIEYCHRIGVLTSASVIANGDDFAGAVEVIRRNPRLGVGVHLNLDSFRPLSRGTSSIIDPGTGGFFPASVVRSKVQHFRVRVEDLVREYSAQIERVNGSGIVATHLDHHQHLHLYWPVLRAMIEVARTYGIRCIRSQRLLVTENKSLSKRVYRAVHQTYLKSRRETPDGYTEFICKDFGAMYRKIAVLVTRRYRVVEIMTHPSRSNPAEVSFLTDARVIELLSNTELVSFAGVRDALVNRRHVCGRLEADRHMR